jgi:hypothetical protein
MKFAEMWIEFCKIELEWFWKKTVFAGFGFLMFILGAMVGYWLQGCVC